jgi:hypothetical protein
MMHHGIPAAKQERYAEVASLLESFGQAHLDPELTGFTLELWRRICRKQSMDCRRGEATLWAATVVHIVARINFLFDRAQPVHLTFDLICESFGAKKTTVGGKATSIERTLGLRQHNEPGLTLSKFMDMFTTVQLSNGMIVTLAMAKQMGLVQDDPLAKN